MPPERIIYAIGDIHGRADLLRGALKAMAEHNQGRSPKVVFLGDYVDRGPDSRGVIEILYAMQEHSQFVCLKGNHEDLMLKALDGDSRDNFERWVAAGGDATLRSYGCETWEDAQEHIPKAHLQWMRALPTTSGDSHRIYVHAGLMPSVPMESQSAEAFMWIRERFLRAEPHQFEAHIVHGHTPIWAEKTNPALPEFRPHRTNLDSGAYMTDVLTVGVFDADQPGGPINILRITGYPGQTVTSQCVTPEYFGPTETGPPPKPEKRKRFGFF